MDYNSTREKLIIPEYGRNVQQMAAYVVSIEDREKRTNMAKALISVMAQLHPENKDTQDYKQKLWDHLHIISDFKLDVDGPYPPPAPDIIERKPLPIPYPQNNIRFRPYGKNIEKIIEKACEFEDGAEKDALVKNIANHLKKSYLNWNRDSVNDDLITGHLDELSHGKLKLSDDARLAHTNDLLKSSPAAATPPSRSAGTRRKKYNPKSDRQSHYRDNRSRKKN